jgi:hypothetical protein
MGDLVSTKEIGSNNSIIKEKNNGKCSVIYMTPNKYYLLNVFYLFFKKNF